MQDVWLMGHDGGKIDPESGTLLLCRLTIEMPELRNEAQAAFVMHPVSNH